ncbi:hypothetical protein MO973_40055 [Paenibacillus sp. TRM 82003]|nr:hypothetical protein [Paenibacillus sp. TRM 82003]
MTEGWPDDRLTSASDVPSVVRHRAGPPGDPDRYELLGEADGPDEAWHVLDHRAAAGEALFTLVALRPPVAAAATAGADGPEGEDGGAPPPDPAAVERTWRERAAGLARVRHERLAAVLSTFTGPAPHPPGRVAGAEDGWNYAVVEQAPGRSVADWLRDDPGAGVEERFAVLAAAAGVLQELHRGTDHSPPLVHGALTPRTVRLGGFFPGDGVRLAGAGLGGLRADGSAREPGPCTAPEVRAGELPSAAGDVFSFAATAVFVLTGQPPATGADGALDTALVRRQLAAAPHTAAHPRIAELLLEGLAQDPRQRPDRLPGWVNAMRAVATPAPVPEGPDAWASPVPAAPAPASARPARVRTLPRRPLAVVVGALLLATAGTAIAVTAVQQGRLDEVPNPVAIVQPPPTGVLPTSAPAAPEPSAQQPSGEEAGEESGEAPDGPAATGRAPARTGGSAPAPGTPAGPSAPPAAGTPAAPSGPPAATSAPVVPVPPPTATPVVPPPAAQGPGVPPPVTPSPPTVPSPPAPSPPAPSPPAPGTTPPEAPPATTEPPLPPPAVPPAEPTPSTSSTSPTSSTSTEPPVPEAPPVTPGGFTPGEFTPRASSPVGSSPAEAPPPS